MHAGEREGRPSTGDSLTTPIVQTSTFHFRDTREVMDFQEGRHSRFEYGRYGNPTVEAAAEKIRALEGAETCVVAASGMNAITTLMLALLPRGGHLITTRDCYRRTRQFISTLLPKLQIEATVIDPADLGALERALERPSHLFFSESPTNPYLRVIDIPAVCERCHAAGAPVVIDSTFATPLNQRALELGADVVLHSGTKYLAGHNDVLAGALAGGREALTPVRELLGILGGVLDPHAAYLLLRGMKTLAIRVEQQNRSALTIARHLERHPRIRRVHYPGLESHPDHEIAVRQMSGFGGVVSFEIDGGLQRAAKFVDALRIAYLAPSFGGVESLVEQPTVMSYWDQTPTERAALGILDNLVRFSCGLEDTADLLTDLDQALDRI
ncbi:MAG: trans-sulfuration enzyme family protein [Myxococcota bacterium]